LVKASENIPGFRAEVGALMGDKAFLLAAAALGAYCIVLTVLWTSGYQYHAHEVPQHNGQWFEQGPFLLLMGRLAGIVLMQRLAPLRLLQWCAGLGLVTIALAAAVGGMTGWTALAVSSLFLSITFPTVYGSALGRNATRMAVVAGMLAITCGVCNALSSLLSALALDTFSLNPRIVVLAALPFEAIILIYALKSHVAGRAKAANPMPVQA